VTRLRYLDRQHTNILTGVSRSPETIVEPVVRETTFC
jgi:hypothetical protein